MRVIARIPDVAERDESAPRPAGEAAAPRGSRRARPGGVLTPLADAWPTWPVAALAVVAVVTWLLASWNDQARLERQRSEMRLAREPAASRHLPAPAPAGGGAVVR